MLYRPATRFEDVGRLDSGPGIKHRPIRREIFDEFQQVDNTSNPQEGRHRARSVDLAAHRRAAWRPHRRPIRGSARARCSRSRFRSRWRRRRSNEGAGAQDDRKKAQDAAKPDDGEPAPPQRRDRRHGYRRAQARTRRGPGAADCDLGDAAGLFQARRGELEPVFQAVLANAVRICKANFGNLLLFCGKLDFRIALPAQCAARLRRTVRRRKSCTCG